MKRAFSLIELLIVIVIVGVVYTLAVSKLQSVGEEKLSPSLLTLKEYLSTFFKEDVHQVKLVCLDECSECLVLVDGREHTKMDAFFDESIEVYRFDPLYGAVEIEKGVYFNEDDVQEDLYFSFSLSSKKVAQQMIVVYKEKAYDYTNYFEPTKVYDSLSELIDAKEQEFQEVKR